MGNQVQDVIVKTVDDLAGGFFDDDKVVEDLSGGEQAVPLKRKEENPRV